MANGVPVSLINPCQASSCEPLQKNLLERISVFKRFCFVRTVYWSGWLKEPNLAGTLLIRKTDTFHLILEFFLSFILYCIVLPPS